MNIQPIDVQCILISDVPALDPIRVVFHDIGPKEGLLLVQCYDQAWSAWWGGMPESKLLQFVARMDPDYLASNLCRKASRQVQAWLAKITRVVIDAAKELAPTDRAPGLSSKTVELRSAYEWTCDECGRDNFARALPWELNPDETALIDENSDGLKNVIRNQFEDGNPGRFSISSCKSPDHVTCEHCGVSFKVQTSRDDE